MTLKEEAEQLAKDRPTSLSDDLYQWAMDAEEMLWKLSAQAAQPAQPERAPSAWVSQSGDWVTTSKAVAEHHEAKGQTMTPLYK